jgi:hypothetical protein
MPHDGEQVKKLCLNLASLSGFIVCGLLLSTLAGCGSVRERYTERHTIKDLTVVFLDEDSLHEQWKQISGSDAVRFQPQTNKDVPNVHTVKGFFDFTSNTLYCPKWNFEVCGHELHHAALGRFHPTN